MGYKGAFGLEYWPTMKDDLSLKQTKKYFGI
jgi:hydroxypyruvate isomerase